MKEVIKFKLKGQNAVIRKPESNSIYFTYHHIHKIALLGILGAIIGENGYNYSQLKEQLNSKSKSKVKELPEFYEHLKNLQISVMPNTKTGHFSNKIQTFNNSVGYASKEEGNNLIVKEQFLENPSWEIYLLSNESKEYSKIKEYLLHQKCEYIPYLGKNEHFADISEVAILEAQECHQVSGRMDSIFSDNSYESEDDIEFMMNFDEKNKFEFKEVMPTTLDVDIGYTNFKEFTFTNKNLKIKEANQIYNVNGKNLYFF